MITAETQTNELAEFNKTLGKYISVSSKTTEQALAAKGNDFAWSLSARMKGLAPGKGTIRAERIAAMKRGEGVIVRPSVRKKVVLSAGGRFDIRGKYTFGKRGASTKSVSDGGVRKRLNIRQLMVRRELALRESGSGFLSTVARFQNRGAYSLKNIKPNLALYHIAKANQIVASAGLKIDPTDATLKLTLGSDQSSAGEGFDKAQQASMIVAALRDVRRDMASYLQEKQLQSLRVEIWKGVK